MSGTRPSNQDDSVEDAPTVNDFDLKKARMRSPSYPAFNLQDCIERARIVLQKAGSNAKLPLPVLAQLWGFKDHKGGSFNITIAALKKFGLLEEVGVKGEGNRRLQLTHDAGEILYGPTSPHYWSKLRAAALKPRIHADLYSQHGVSLPERTVLHYALVKQGGFSEQAFEWLIREYQETMAFARVESPDSDTAVEANTKTNEDFTGLEEEDQQTICGTPTPNVSRATGNVNVSPSLSASIHQKAGAFQILLGSRVLMSVECPMTKAKFGKLKLALDLWEDELVESPAEPIEP